MTPDHKKKLFLLDAFALIYRAYFAFQKVPRVTSKGLNTSAVFGFTLTLLDLIKKENPSHMAVVFDTPEPTARHTEFEAYKANREEMPEDLSIAIPYIIRLVEAFNIPVVKLPGFEADDVIGTLAKRAEKQGYTTYMVTPDKDFGQLVSEHIYIYKPARSGNEVEIMGVEEVCKRWEIKNVDQVIDILGLMGDAVDNIPGIPGVGEKTAIQFIKDFGSVENLLQNTDKLKGKMKEKVELNKEMAIQSKRLATIICDAPLEMKVEELIRQEPHKDQLRELFAELEFRQIAEKVLGEPLSGSVPAEKEHELASTRKPKHKGQTDLFGTASSGTETETATETELETKPEEITPFRTIADTAHTYHLADTEAGRKNLVDTLKKENSFCFDTETTGLDVQTAELVGMSFSWEKGTAWYVPVPADQGEAQKLVDAFKPLFENEKIGKTGQNIKYDLSMMKRYGVELKGPLFDTMIAHYLIQPDMRHNMDVLAQTYLNYAPVSIETLIGKKGKGQISMRDVDAEKICEYAAEDADVTFQLKETFAPMLVESGAQKLFETMEMPLVPVLAAMESEGIRVDKNALKELSQELEKDILLIDKEIQEIAGTRFNISSPKQVGDILFEVLKIMEKPKKTKTGQYATGEDILTKLVGKHPIVGKILDFRELVKLKNTYVDTLPDLINPRTGRIHTSYNQVVASTGRLSSDNPNLQNIPIRTERGKEVRKAFVPRGEGYTLMSADYSQIELRIIAELSGDEGMINAFQSGHDIHAATAAKVYNVALEAVTGDMRRNAKMVNFGIIYGISAFGLSERLNIPRKEAGDIIQSYFAQYPKLKSYMDACIEGAKSKGYVETILGRRRYLRDINSANATVRGFAERNAINAPIQGSAADMIKLAMISIHKELIEGGYKSRMLLQVHDELVFDVPEDEVERIKPMVEKHMRTAIPMKVPMEVGIGCGKNWLDAH
ncbi:MAG: DNA polymerase I [Bacteroidia bacterium]